MRRELGSVRDSDSADGLDLMTFGSSLMPIGSDVSDYRGSENGKQRLEDEGELEGEWEFSSAGEKSPTKIDGNDSKKLRLDEEVESSDEQLHV